MQKLVPMLRMKVAAKCPALAEESTTYDLVASNMEFDSMPVELSKESFKACLMGKLMAAKNDCSGPTCTYRCKAALNRAISSMDGSCCSEAPAEYRGQCVQLVTQKLVPMLRMKVAAKCPALPEESTTYDLVASNMEFDSMPVELSKESFKACLMGKLMAAKNDCSGPTCTYRCKAALNSAISSLDGSCSSEAS